MRPEDFDIQKLIETLQGTCLTINDGISQLHPEAYDQGFDEDQLTDEERSTFDMEIFNCDTCNWWFETCEKGTDNDGCGTENCTDCQDEINESE